MGQTGRIDCWYQRMDGDKPHKAQRIKRDKVTPMLKSLHWLPIRYGIKYKVNLITFKALHVMAPHIWKQYWYHIIHWLHFDLLIWTICKNITAVHHKVRRKIFLCFGSKLWNKLPQKITNIDTVAQFKTALKEHQSALSIIFVMCYISKL